MNDELFFRASLVLVSAALLTIRLYYGWRVRASRRRVLARRAGIAPTALLYFSGGGAAVASLVYIVAPQSIVWAALPLPALLRWLGVIVGIVVIALFFWTHRALGKNWAMPAVIQE